MSAKEIECRQKDEVISGKDEVIRGKNEALQHLDKVIRETTSVLAEKDEALRQRDATIQAQQIEILQLSSQPAMAKKVSCHIYYASKGYMLSLAKFMQIFKLLHPFAKGMQQSMCRQIS